MGTGCGGVRPVPCVPQTSALSERENKAAALPAGRYRRTAGPLLPPIGAYYWAAGGHFDGDIMGTPESRPPLHSYQDCVISAPLGCRL